MDFGSGTFKGLCGIGTKKVHMYDHGSTGQSKGYWPGVLWEI